MSSDPWNSLSETDVDRFRAIRFDEEKGELVKDESPQFGSPDEGETS